MTVANHNVMFCELEMLVLPRFHVDMCMRVLFSVANDAETEASRG